MNSSTEKILKKSLYLYNNIDYYEKKLVMNNSPFLEIHVNEMHLPVDMAKTLTGNGIFYGKDLCKLNVFDLEKILGSRKKVENIRKLLFYWNYKNTHKEPKFRIQ